MNFYAMVLVMVLLEVLHYEVIAGELFPNALENNKERLGVTLIGIIAVGILFGAALAGNLPVLIAKDEYVGIYVFCIFSFVMNVSLFYKVLKKIES